jgi:flagellar motor component MotA
MGGNMAEPVSHITATATVAVAAPTIAVLFQLWPFGIAFVAGCVALIYMAPMSNKNAIRSVVGSVFTGGGLSQVVAAPALHYIGTRNEGLLVWSKEPNAEMIAIAMLAMVIGLFAQSVIPKLLIRAGNEIGGQP